MSPVLGQTYDNQNCPIASSLELVGERWSLLILRDAVFAGTTRFADFQRSLGLASNVLSARLDRFVAAGLMERRPSAQTKYREYVLTEKGRELKPVLIALGRWGGRWAAPKGPQLVLEHAGCGGKPDQQVVCSSCGEIVALDEVSVRRSTDDRRNRPTQRTRVASAR